MKGERDVALDDVESATSWDTRAVISLLHEIEQTFDVDRWLVGEWHVWPLLRIMISFQLDELATQKVKSSRAQIVKRVAQRALSIPMGVLRYASYSARDWKHCDTSRRPVDAVIISYPTARRLNIHGRWFDVYAGPMEIELARRGIRSLILEYDDAYKFKVPRYGQSQWESPVVAARALRALLGWSRWAISSETIAGLESLRRMLRERAIVQALPDAAGLKMRASYIRYMADQYKRIARRTGARLFIGSNYYGFREMAANLAAHEMGLTSVDIQHGVQGEFHAAYGRWTKVPLGGYELLPRVFWTWTHHEARVINSWSQRESSHHFALVGGNLVAKLADEENGPLRDIMPEATLSVLKRNEGKIHVLVTLQTGREIPTMCIDAMRSSPREWFWWIRLHPNMLGERESIRMRLRKAGLENYSLDEATDTPLQSLFGWISIHVTESSSVVLEATEVNIRSVLMHKTGELLFANAVREGMAVPALTPDRVVSAIAECIRERGETGQTRDLRITSNAFETLLKLAGLPRSLPTPIG